MCAIALIRHGAYQQLPNTPSALQPFPLTPQGAEDVRQQARQFGQWLKTSGYRLRPEVHCSTLLRAWQTAELFREELSSFFVSAPSTHSFSALCERSVGALANLSVGEIERIVAQDPRLDDLPTGWKSTSDFRLPFDGAESLLEAGKRVADHLRPLCTEAPDDQIQLVIGHGASIRHACYHLNMIAFEDVAKLSMHFGHPVVFKAQGNDWTNPYGHWKKRKTTDSVD